MDTTNPLPGIGLISSIDRLAQQGLGTIATLARTALEVLEASDATQPPVRMIGRLLEAIRSLAGVVANDINGTAEATAFRSL